MTAPFEFEAPELFSAGTQAIVERASSLGLTWGLRPATIITVTAAMVTARYDGDAEAIAMSSLLPGLFVGARVMAIQVPPAGNYIFAFLDNGSGVYYIGANITTQGTVVTTPATETAVPSASWDSEPLFRFQGRGVFELHATGTYIQSADQQVINVSIRQGAATISGTLLWLQRAQAAQAFVATTFDFIGYFKNASTTDIYDNLSMTITKAAGVAGNVSLAGTTGIAPLTLRVAQIGTLDSLPSLAIDLQALV